MPIPSEQKSVQARILKDAHEIGLSYVSRNESEKRRSFDHLGIGLWKPLYK